MQPYHKIQTVYKRDPRTNFKTLLEGEWSLDEFEYLAFNTWTWTEKVDGTNIRVHYDSFSNDVYFYGKSDKAQIPTFLLDQLIELFPPECFVASELPTLTLYGEGYGNKIQAVGNSYIHDGVDFILFDVNVNGLWLERRNVEDIADKLGINIVPIVGYGTLIDAIETVKYSTTFYSQVSCSMLEAEGLVLRPEMELLNRRGNRIITKIKRRDFLNG